MRSTALLLTALAAPALSGQSVTSVIVEQSRTAFTIQGAGARAVGTGGAFIAVADDATAVSFNPAGLAQLLRPEVSLTGQTVGRDASLRGFATQDGTRLTTQEDSSASDRHSHPSFFSVTLPMKKGGLNTTFQLSYQRILDFGSDATRSYQNATVGSSTLQRINQEVHQKGGIDLYSLAVGTELNGRILLGAAVNFWNGDWRFSSVSQERTGTTLTFASELAQVNRFRGWNANLGAIWRSEHLNLGLVYRSPFKATYTFENYYVTPDPFTGLPSVTHGEMLPYPLHWPETLGWGAGVRPVPRLLLTADWARTTWSRANFASEARGYGDLNFFDLQAVTRTPDVTDFHTGLEWVAWLGDQVVVPLRLGWFREPQPLVDPRTFTQKVFRGWTAGFGVKRGALTLDAAFKVSKGSRFVSRLNASAPAGGFESYAYGTETIEERRGVLSLIWQLDPEKVRRGLGWLLRGE